MSGELIRKIRISLNLSQTRFGRRLGVSGKTISAYETGRVKVPDSFMHIVNSNYVL